MLIKAVLSAMLMQTFLIPYVQLRSSVGHGQKDESGGMGGRKRTGLKDQNSIMRGGRLKRK